MEAKNVEKLPDEFIGTGEVKGFEFKKNKESDNAYIFEVNSGENIHYEVFEKIISPKCINFEKRIYSETEFKESYPKSSCFGITAFTFDLLEKAIEKFKSI